MIKVKIINVSHSYCYECDGNDVFYPMSGDWEEVSDSEYQKIRTAVQDANSYSRKRNYNNAESYLLISYDDNTLGNMFQKASDFRKHMDKEKQKEADKKANVALKKAATALERKRKQFEKLKKELSE